LIYLLVNQSYANGKHLSDHINWSSTVEVKIEHLTSSRFAARIDKPQTAVGQFLQTTKGVNPQKGQFLDAVTHPKTGGAELSYPLDQSG
jgi:hypothetical protein